VRRKAQGPLLFVVQQQQPTACISTSARMRRRPEIVGGAEGPSLDPADKRLAS
jgi:hypothetical protein